MKRKKYYLSQDELGMGLRSVIDSYINDELSNRQLEEYVKTIVKLNEEKYYTNGKVSVRVERKLGKKRIGIIDKILC